MLKKTLLLILLFTCLPLVAAEKEQFNEGVNYFEVFPTYPGSEPGKIEVVEFFWYNCPHCYDFEPHLEQWLASKPADVNYIQAPVIFNETARFHAEVYYSLQMMGLGHDLQMKIFAEIHDKKQKLNDIDTMIGFLAKQGVDSDKFRQTVKSFAVQTRVNRADDMAKRFGISSVPNMVVNGSWRTGRTKGYEEMVKLVDFLINKARQEEVASKQ